jgi:transcriptional regulator with XRE-family HTH domain
MPKRKFRGSALRAARRRAGLSQVEAARRAGITQGHWSGAETEREYPSLETVLRLARAIGADPQELDGDLASTGAG